MPLYFLLAAALVAVDQVVKYLVRAGIPLHTAVDFLPGLDLTYVQNTGAAFSLLAEHTWILTLISVLVVIVMVIALWKKVLTHPRGGVRGSGDLPGEKSPPPLVGDAGPGPSAGRGRGELH